MEVAQLSPGTPDYYTVEEFWKMELYLLRFFNWSVSFPASVHFTDYYLQYGTLLDEEDMMWTKFDAAQLKKDMKAYTADFLEAALRSKHRGLLVL